MVGTAAYTEEQTNFVFEMVAKHGKNYPLIAELFKKEFPTFVMRGGKEFGANQVKYIYGTPRNYESVYP
jgi:hypothetical protein